MIDDKTPERWLNVEEIANHLGVSSATVYRWLAKKTIPAHRVGKLWKFKASEVDKWVQSEAKDQAIEYKKTKDKTTKDKTTKDKTRQVRKKSPKQAPPAVGWLCDLWNEHCGNLPKVRTPVSKTRSTNIARAVKELPKQEDWLKAIKAAAESEFCNGSGDKGWVASFDWIIKPDVAHKLLEGKYSNKKLQDPWDAQAERLKKEYAERNEKVVNDIFPQKEVDHEW